MPTEHVPTVNSITTAPSVLRPSRARVARVQEGGIGLIEVVVVMVILAILGTVALVAGRSTARSADTKSAVATARAYADAVRAFTADHGGRTPTLGEADWPESIDGVDLEVPAFTLGPVDVGSNNRRYLDAVPEAVQGGAVLFNSGPVAADPAPSARTRVTYVHVDENSWRIDVEASDTAAGANSWTVRCSVGDDLPNGVPPC